MASTNTQYLQQNKSSSTSARDEYYWKLNASISGSNITYSCYVKGYDTSLYGTYYHYIDSIYLYKNGSRAATLKSSRSTIGYRSSSGGSYNSLSFTTGTATLSFQQGDTLTLRINSSINDGSTFTVDKSITIDVYEPSFPGYSWKSLGSGSTSTSISYSLSDYQVGRYSFTPSVNGTLSVSTTGASDSYGGIGTSLSLASSDSTGDYIVTGELVDNDDSSGTQFSCSYSVTASTRYYVFVHNYYGNADSGTLNITFTPSVIEYTCTMNPNGGKYLNSSGNYATANVTYTFNSNHTYAPFCATSTTAGVTSPATDTGIVARYYPSKPIRTGYTFNSWTANPSTVTITAYSFGAGAMYSSRGKPGCSFTATANWTANSYTITYNVNGGNALSTTTKSVTYDSTYGTLASPTRTGYTFDGWYTAASGGTKITSSTKVSITANQTLYAHWTANTYTVTLNVNGGSGISPTTKSVTYNSTYGDFPVTARIGYTLKGWFTAASGGTQITSTSTVTTAGNHTLYAQWTPNTFTITYDANGGNTPTPTTTSVTYNSTYGTLATCTRTGYTFKGWFTAASGGTQITSSSTVTITRAQTLYAQWIPITYTIAYNANGGTGTMASSSHQYGVAKNLTTNTFTHLGYTFIGWSESSTATSATYTDSESVINLSKTNGATITLYAVWEPYSNVYIYSNGSWHKALKYIYSTLSTASTQLYDDYSGIEYEGSITYITGQTWAEWCNSTYNTPGLYCSGGHVYGPNGTQLYEAGTTNAVLSTDTINSNGYEFV